jgi:long-chain fatty acid transport protein
MKKLLGSVAVVAVALCGIEAQATDGINLIGLGPVQKGTAGAGVASGHDSTWLIVNPAALVDVDARIDASVEVFAPNRSINSTVSGGAGQQNDDSMFIIPSISASFGCCHSDNGFLGIGLYGTSGMGVDYDFGRMGADTDGNMMPDTPQNMGDTMTELSIAKMTMVYARRFENDLSVGIGPVAVLSRLKMDMFNGMGFGSGDWDTSTGVGGIVGVQKQVGPVALGASYMSEQFMQEFDEYETAMPDSLNLPQQATAGIAFSPLNNVEIALDYQWIDWAGVDTFGDLFGWESQNIIKAGITCIATDALTLRGGVSHGNSPIDADNAFSNALFPAIMETHVACGASYEFDALSINFAYVHAMEETVTANGNDMAAQGFGPMGAGTEISMYQDTFTVGVGYRF